jgi:hypothetical protein
LLAPEGPVSRVPVPAPPVSVPTPPLARRGTPAQGLSAAGPAAPEAPLAPPQTMADAIRSSHPPPPPRSSPTPPKAPIPLARRLLPGLAVAGSSIVLTLLDRVYAAVAGEVFTLGPLKTSMLAALLLLGGLALVGRELLKRETG